jgi:hypothetical protein
MTRLNPLKFKSQKILELFNIFNNVSATNLKPSPNHNHRKENTTIYNWYQIKCSIEI